MRTLTDKGETTTSLSVKALFDCTHSYTVMPVITSEGKFYSKILICFQEKNGVLGPIVKKSLISCPNILVTCSHSGKLTK